jgi:hypothetical protein
MVDGCRPEYGADRVVAGRVHAANAARRSPASCHGCGGRGRTDGHATAGHEHAHTRANGDAIADAVGDPHVYAHARAQPDSDSGAYGDAD